MSLTKGMQELHLGMSNFDHEVDTGFADALKAQPAKVFGRHAGWNFNGRVWFEGGEFCEEVWVYGSPREVIREKTLPELMEAVSNKYGDD